LNYSEEQKRLRTQLYGTHLGVDEFMDRNHKEYKYVQLEPTEEEKALKAKSTSDSSGGGHHYMFWGNPSNSSTTAGNSSSSKASSADAEKGNGRRAKRTVKMRTGTFGRAGGGRS
jgi:hypothetical protein